MVRYYMLVAVACLGIGGCAPVLIGGGAAGGYYVAKQERSAGEIADDAAITAAVNAKYVKDDIVKARDIDVDTYRGVVTLKGTVGSAAAARRAVSLAQSVKGVRKVISKLKIVTG